jgi:type II secretory pathway component PulJ
MNQMVLVDAGALVVAIALLAGLLLSVLLLVVWLVNDDHAERQRPEPLEALQRELRYIERDTERASRQAAQRYLRDADEPFVRRKSS